MEPHRSIPRPRRSTTRADPDGPLDFEWLHARGVAYAAQWETTSAATCALLERKIDESCRRAGKSNESAEDARRLIPAVIESLVDRGYIDDLRFAKHYVERLVREARSTAKIRACLERKGVPEALVEKILSGLGEDYEEQAAWKFARKKRLGPFSLDTSTGPGDHNRQLALLGRHGFEESVALRVVETELPPATV